MGEGGGNPDAEYSGGEGHRPVEQQVDQHRLVDAAEEHEQPEHPLPLR